MDPQLVKKCRVCGDAALSFNYNGLCCLSCKMFFRRNALNHANLKCLENGCCTIDVTTRKHCQLCRLNKCIQIGMRKDMIVDNLTTSTSETQCRLILKCENNLLRKLLKKVDDEISKGESDDEINKVKKFKYNSLENEKNLINKKTNVDVRIRDVPLPSEEIKKAILLMQELGDPSDHQIHGNKAFNQDSQLQKMLKFVNSIEGFRSLPQHDQMIVFIKVFPQILLLHSAFSFNFENNACYVPMNQFYASYIRLDELYNFGTNSETAKRLHRRLVFQIREDMDNDVIIRELVSVMLLFNSKDSISCLEYIRHQYFFYCHLLQRYIQCKYLNPRKADKKFIKIQQIVNDIGSFKHINQI